MKAILLVDHGSRLAEANRTLDQLAELVRARADSGTIVAIAHLELAPPTIEEAIAAIAGAGARDLVVVPYFLAPGRHASEDVPRRVADSARIFPALRWRISGVLGAHPLLAELVLARVNDPAD